MPTSAKKKERLIDPQWKRWKKAMVRLKSVRVDCAENPSPHGEKWTYNMLKHWDRKIADWVEMEPTKYLD